MVHTEQWSGIESKGLHMAVFLTMNLEMVLSKGWKYQSTVSNLSYLWFYLIFYQLTVFGEAQ